MDVTTERLLVWQTGMLTARPSARLFAKHQHVPRDARPWIRYELEDGTFLFGISLVDHAHEWLQRQGIDYWLLPPVTALREMYADRYPSGIRICFTCPEHHAMWTLVWT